MATVTLDSVGFREGYSIQHQAAQLGVDAQAVAAQTGIAVDAALTARDLHKTFTMQSAGPALEAIERPTRAAGARSERPVRPAEPQVAYESPPTKFPWKRAVPSGVAAGVLGLIVGALTTGLAGVVVGALSFVGFFWASNREGDGPPGERVGAARASAKAAAQVAVTEHAGALLLVPNAPGKAHRVTSDVFNQPHRYLPADAALPGKRFLAVVCGAEGVDAESLAQLAAAVGRKRQGTGPSVEALVISADTPSRGPHAIIIPQGKLRDLEVDKDGIRFADLHVTRGEVRGLVGYS